MVKVALVGIGGYGARHLSVLRTLQNYGLCRLCAVVDPFADRQTEVVAGLQSDGIAVYSDLAPVLECDEIEAIFLATPISLHASQTVASLEAGKHVFLEKPPCISLEDFGAMKTAQKRSEKVCAVGFQWQTSPALRFLKRQLVRGSLGELQTVWAASLTRREDAYYERAAWAGRLHCDGHFVFDGPVTNARSHVVHAMLFLAGETENEWARLQKVRGTFKRARPIESYDTAYLEAQTRQGVQLKIALTHATARSDDFVLHCRGTGGEARLTWDGDVVLQTRLGEVVKLHWRHEMEVAVALDFLHAVRGANDTPPHQPATNLDDVLPFLQLVNGAYQSAGGISSFVPEQVSRVGEGAPEAFYAVSGLNSQFDAFERDPSQAPPHLACDKTRWLAISALGSSQ